MITTCGYIFYQISEVEHGHRDNYSSREITNTFEDGFNEKLMKDNAFFPMIEIRTLVRRKNFTQYGHGDVFEPGDPNDKKMDINFDELKRYITTRMTIKYKNNGKSHYRNIPFSKCKREDFIRRGLKIEEGKNPFERNTICPNLDGVEDFWKLKNSYQNDTERVSFNIEQI